MDIEERRRINKEQRHRSGMSAAIEVSTQWGRCEELLHGVPYGLRPALKSNVILNNVISYSKMFLNIIPKTTFFVALTVVMIVTLCSLLRCPFASWMHGIVGRNLSSVKRQKKSLTFIERQTYFHVLIKNLISVYESYI